MGGGLQKSGHRKGGFIQQLGRPSLKKTRTKNIFVFMEPKDINSN